MSGLPDFPTRVRAAVAYSGLSAPEIHRSMAEHGQQLNLKHVYLLIRGDVADPRFKTLAALVKTLDVPSDWFFSDDVDAEDGEALARYVRRQRDGA